MQRLFFVSALLACGLMFGCGHRPETGQSVTEVCHASNNGKLKIVSGYIGTASTPTSCVTTCNLKLRAQKDVQGVEIDVKLPMGTENNELGELPSEFTDKDIQIKDNEGKVITGGDVVRVTGRLSVTTRHREVDCTIVPEKVEKLSNWL